MACGGADVACARCVRGERASQEAAVWGGEGGAGGVAAREGWGGLLPGPAAVEEERAARVGAKGTAGR